MGSFSATVIVNNVKGLHARPAGAFMDVALRFSSSVTIERVDNAQTGNGKSLMGLLSLALVQGTEVHIHAEGEDAEAALAALVEMVAADFGEG